MVSDENDLMHGLFVLLPEHWMLLSCIVGTILTLVAIQKTPNSRRTTNIEVRPEIV